MPRKKSGKFKIFSYKKDIYLSICFFVIGTISRFPFLEKYQSHWDGPQYSIGVLRYSLQQSAPALPGYPLYIGAGKILNYFIKDPHLALLYLGVIFSGIGGVAIYLLGRNLFNKYVGIISALILLSSPAFYYFGVTTYGYVVLPAMISLLALGVYLNFIKGKNYVLLTTIIFSLYIAMRPQEIFYILPLYLLSFWKQKPKEIVLQLLINILVLVLWIIPVSDTIGGFRNYIQTSFFTANQQATGGLQLILKGGWYDIFVLRIFRGIFLTLGISGLLLILYIFTRLNKVFSNTSIIKIIQNKKVIFYSVWIIPPVLFNIFMRVEHAGYMFVYLIPLIIFSAYAIYKLFGRFKYITSLIVMLVLIFNLYNFFRDRDPNFQKPYSPTSFHYSEIQKNNFKMGEKIKFIKNNFSSNNSVIIIATPELFRPVMYHLKEYSVYQFDALFTSDAQYRNIRRYGKNLLMDESREASHEIQVPASIKNIIIFDDGVVNWKNKNIQIKGFSKNTFIGIVINDNDNIYEYDKEKFIKK